MSIGMATVARMKKGPDGSAPEEREPGRKPKQTIMSIRGAPEWKAWLDRLAEHDRSTSVQVIDKALADYARKVKFPEAPPKR
jgi:hypothetical protein